MPKLAALVFFAAYSLHASMIATGSLPGMLSNADLVVPDNPNNAPVPMMSNRAEGSWSGTVMVTGESGSGYLVFDLQAFATSFSGPVGNEHMDSESSVTGSGSAYSVGWNPQGSSAGYCRCYVPIAFNVPERLTFTGTAYSMYSFYPLMPNLPAYLAGNTIHTWAAVSFAGVVDAQGNSLMSAGIVNFEKDKDDANATHMPEPQPFILVAAGICLCIWFKRETSKSK